MLRCVGNSPWKFRAVARVLAEGCTLAEAAVVVRANPSTLWRWRRACAEFAAAVEVARAAGRAEREFRCWLRHPFRGLRPPAGRGHGGRPRFRYGRR